MAATFTSPSSALKTSRHIPLSDVFLAALPHLLMSSTFFGVSIAFGGRGMPWYPYFLVVALVIALLYAWRRDWPLGSGSWAGYGLVPVALILELILGRTLWGNHTNQLPGLSLAIGSVFIARRRPLHALLASMPLLTLIPRLFYFEHLSGGHLIFGGAFVLLAASSSIIVCRGTRRVAITTAIFFHLFTGAAFTLGTFFLPFDLGPFSAGMQAAPRRMPSSLELLGHFLPIPAASIAASLALLVVPTVWRRFLGRGSA